jgi:hypothetical protein
LSQISAIQFKKGNAFTNGYIQFTVAGGNENTRGIFQATQDENTVMFVKKYNDDAEELKRKIYSLK